MPIARLSKLLVNQIAAGEVIERPASVVKELVENSLDAGATRIEVRIEDGGRELVRVADDGSGIPSHELTLAVEPHATSKIATAADLEAITTMGFRGEALASIAAVSRLRLISRVRDHDAGAVVEASGDALDGPSPAGCAPGTVVEVRNLFFNTPARRKFMRSTATEYGHVHEMLTRIALAHPQVAFKLTHDERVAIDLPAGQTPSQRAIALLGEDLREALLEFDSEERGVKLWGLAGMPAVARATAKHQYVYVNGRPVRDRNIAHAVKEAYRGLIEPAQQPMIVLFVELHPTLVDVNVHPTKSEVRFADANVVHGQVLAAVRQRLLQGDLTPNVHIGAKSPGASPLGGGQTAALDMFAAQRAAAAPLPDADPGTDDDAPARFVDFFRRMDPKQKGFIYQQVRQEMNPGTDDTDVPGSGSLDQAAALTDAIRRTAEPILQVHNAYIVTQDEQGIVIIDQHALHERVMFQTLYDRICRDGSLESQRLLTPAVLTVTAVQMSLLDRLEPLLRKLGIEARAMGPTTVAVDAFATLLFDRGVEPEDFVRGLLEKAEAEGLEPNDEAALHEVLDMMSCKAAVKAGDAMKPDELSSLLAQRDRIERASNCPHGRPTTIRLTLSELEKHFKRS